MHLFGCALKESSAACDTVSTSDVSHIPTAHLVEYHTTKAQQKHKHTSDEQRVPGKHHTILSILHQIADAVLRVTGRMKRRDGDLLSNGELLAMLRCLGNRLAILATRYRQTTELIKLNG